MLNATPDAFGVDSVAAFLHSRIENNDVRKLIDSDRLSSGVDWKYRVLLNTELYRSSGKEEFIAEALRLSTQHKWSADAALPALLGRVADNGPPGAAQRIGSFMFSMGIDPVVPVDTRVKLLMRMTDDGSLQRRFTELEPGEKSKALKVFRDTLRYGARSGYLFCRETLLDAIDSISREIVLDYISFGSQFEDDTYKIGCLQEWGVSRGLTLPPRAVQTDPLQPVYTRTR